MYECINVCMCIPESEWPFKSFNGPHSAPEGILLNIKNSLGRLEKKNAKSPPRLMVKAAPALDHPHLHKELFHTHDQTA